MILHGSNLPSWYVISIFIVEVYRDESILKWLKHVRCSLGSWKRLVKWIQILPFPPFLNFRKWTKMGWHHRWWPNLAQTSQIWRFSRIFCAALATWFRLGKDSIRITVKSCQNKEKRIFSKIKNESLTNCGQHDQHPSASISIHQHQDPPWFEIA